MPVVTNVGIIPFEPDLVGVPEYRIFIKDHSGVIVDILDNWQEATFIHDANRVGTLALVPISTNTGIVQLLKPDTAVDYLIEVYRRNLNVGLDWYKEWEGLYVDHDDYINRDGTRLFTIYAVSLMDLLGRRYIMFYKDNTVKAGAGSDIIKEYVVYNAGYLASTSNGRIIFGVTPNLSVQANNGLGGAWVGNRNTEPLLSAIQDIADETAVYFDVIGNGDYTWTFNTYYPSRNLDRRLLDVAGNGLNGSGNVPVLFSPRLGNMIEPVQNRNYSDSKNVILAVGSGSGDDSFATVQQDFDATTLSPLNYREAIVNVGQVSDTDALLSAAGEQLEKNKAQDTFECAILQTPTTYYGKDYWFGDLVSVLDNDGILLHKVVRKVVVTVSKEAQVEELEITFEDIPDV